MLKNTWNKELGFGGSSDFTPEKNIFDTI